MEESLKKAAEEGNIDAFYRLIGENPNLLNDIDDKPFIDTPLHISAFHGQTHFAKEMIRLKPSFARKLNKDGFSPMHLALQAEKFETVLQLLQVDKDLVCVQEREGVTPLHHAAKTGNTFILQHFLSACPTTIEDVNIRNETALHIALKSDKPEAFKFLVKWLREACDEDGSYRERMIMTWKDEQGNTVFDLAASKYGSQALKVEENSGNEEGFTALNINDSQCLSNIRVLTNILCKFGETMEDSISSLPPVEYFGHCLKWNVGHKRLNKAAELGDINALYALIRDDPYLLEQIDKVPFIDTPLHIAAVAGHTQFAMEMMRLKPSFSKKPNQDGFSPIHLALQKGHPKMVQQLVYVDEDLVLVKGREGATPLHFVAGSENLDLLTEKDKLDLLAEFLVACPRSIGELTTRRETAIHIAAKKEKIASLRALIGWLELTGLNKVLNWTDDEGNTLLHIACEKNQMEIIKLLVGAATSPLRAKCFPVFRMFVRIKVNLNIQNSEGLKAIEILESKISPTNSREVQAMKRIARILKVTPLHGATTLADNLGRKLSMMERWAVKCYREKLLISDANSKAALVVAVLIATATYQAILSPPGGVWQGDQSSRFSNSTNSNANTTFINGNGNSDSNSSNNAVVNTGPLVYKVGSSVMGFNYWFFFSILNTATFAMSISELYNLLPSRPYFVLLSALALCYALSIIFIAPVHFISKLFFLTFSVNLVCYKILVENFYIDKRNEWLVKRLPWKVVRDLKKKRHKE